MKWSSIHGIPMKSDVGDKDDDALLECRPASVAISKSPDSASEPFNDRNFVESGKACKVEIIVKVCC
jgi:hypothetical protein